MPTLSSALPAVAAAPHASLPGALRVLHRVNPVLAWTGWVNVGLALLALGLLPFDHRVVTGALVWVKPLKFAVSIVLYAWTLGWLLADLPATAQGAVRRISWLTLAAMVVEQGIIFGQAARGVPSHFNQTTLVDGVLFGLMGVFIGLNTVVLAWATYLAWRHQPHGSASYALGMRLGLLLTVVGSVLAGFMVHANQHTMGAPDGGPGLPGLGWSTTAGDLRLAHFMGLHALQALPLLGWALGQRLPARPAVAATWASAALWAAAVAGLLLTALAGRPVL